MRKSTSRKVLYRSTTFVKSRVLKPRTFPQIEAAEFQEAVLDPPTTTLEPAVILARTLLEEEYSDYLERIFAEILYYMSEIPGAPDFLTINQPLPQVIITGMTAFEGPYWASYFQGWIDSMGETLPIPDNIVFDRIDVQAETTPTSRPSVIREATIDTFEAETLPNFEVNTHVGATLNELPDSAQVSALAVVTESGEEPTVSSSTSQVPAQHSNPSVVMPSIRIRKKREVVKKVKCAICQKAYVKKLTLKIHIHKVHGIEKSGSDQFVQSIEI